MCGFFMCFVIKLPQFVRYLKSFFFRTQIQVVDAFIITYFSMIIRSKKKGNVCD